MTGRRGPSRADRRGPRLSQDPGTSNEEAVLSEEEVQRRVNVEGGGRLVPPPPEHKFRDRRPTSAAPRRTNRSAARDSILLVALVIAGVVAIGILLPEGPLTAFSTNPPSPDGTSAAVAPSGAASAGPLPTGVLITLPPRPTGDATQSPAPGTPVAPPPTGPAATPRPGSTPRPTPAPTPRPTRTPVPATPTPPPTASLTVVVSVINGDGGTSTASAWTVTVTSAGTESPGTFPGSSSGTNVTISANATYSVSVEGPSGYATSSSAGCSSGTGGLPAPGSSRTCTIVKNDIAPRVTVTTVVDGGPASPADWTVSVAATDPTPASFAGSAAGVVVRFDANQPYAITSESAAGTDYTLSSSGGCDGSSLPLGGSASCTFTYTYDPPPEETPTPGAALPLLVLAPVTRLRGRTRWTTTRI